MRTPDQALAWLADQVHDPTEDWTNYCEKLCRTAYGLGAHYSSANLHHDAIPGGHRFGTDPPFPGDLILYRNSSYGHIVVATGDGWNVYTNDYGGRGTVCVADARDLVGWCGATTGYVANAWWSNTNKIHTHTEDDDMALTDDDVQRIADAVWKKVLKAPDETTPPLPNNYERNAGALLMKTYAEVYKET